MLQINGIQDKNGVAYFWLTKFRYFLQLIFRLTPLTSAAKYNQKSVNHKLCNSVLILDALYSLFFPWILLLLQLFSGDNFIQSVKRSPKFVFLLKSVLFVFSFCYILLYFSHSIGSYAGHKQEVTPTDNQIRPTTAN